MPAAWLILQAAILVIALSIFTFKPGVAAERFTGLLTGVAIAAVLITAARGLYRAAPLGHIVAVLIFLLESLAFGVSLIQRRGGPWQALQLAIAFTMLALLFMPATRRAINERRGSETDGGMPTY